MVCSDVCIVVVVFVMFGVAVNIVHAGVWIVSGAVLIPGAVFLIVGAVD